MSTGVNSLSMHPDNISGVANLPELRLTVCSHTKTVTILCAMVLILVGSFTLIVCCSTCGNRMYPMPLWLIHTLILCAQRC